MSDPVTVCVQVDVDLLRQQRDWLLQLMFIDIPEPEGLINLVDDMLDKAEGHS